jgi:hypothetical protein
VRPVTRALIAVFAMAAFATPAGLARAAGSHISVSKVVDVSRDQTSQNETPLAVNPANPQNMITGNNDWNYNDGCGGQHHAGRREDVDAHAAQRLPARDHQVHQRPERAGHRRVRRGR